MKNVFEIHLFNVDRLLNTAISWILTITCTIQGSEENRKRTKIVVANRVSLFDSLVLRKIISHDRCKMVYPRNSNDDFPWIKNLFQINLSTEHLFDHWLKSTTISSSRTKEDLLDLCLNEIQRNGRILSVMMEEEEKWRGFSRYSIAVLAGMSTYNRYRWFIKIQVMINVNGWIEMIFSFSMTPFTLAKNLQLPILPICLHVSRPFHVRTV